MCCNKALQLSCKFVDFHTKRLAERSIHQFCFWINVSSASGDDYHYFEESKIKAFHFLQCFSSHSPCVGSLLQESFKLTSCLTGTGTACD